MTRSSSQITDESWLTADAAAASVPVGHAGRRRGPQEDVAVQVLEHLAHAVVAGSGWVESSERLAVSAPAGPLSEMASHLASSGQRGQSLSQALRASSHRWWAAPAHTKLASAAAEAADQRGDLAGALTTTALVLRRARTTNEARRDAAAPLVPAAAVQAVLAIVIIGTALLGSAPAWVPAGFVVASSAALAVAWRATWTVREPALGQRTHLTDAESAGIALLAWSLRRGASWEEAVGDVLAALPDESSAGWREVHTALSRGMEPREAVGALGRGPALVLFDLAAGSDDAAAVLERGCAHAHDRTRTEHGEASSRRLTRNALIACTLGAASAAAVGVQVWTCGLLV